MSSAMEPEPPIVTPCVNICIVDADSGLCLGCWRTLAEVAGWMAMTGEARAAVMAELPARRARNPETLARSG